MAIVKIMLKDPITGDQLLPSTCISAIYNEDGTPWEPPVPTPAIPSGIIVAWSGSANNIPEGWHICDGTEGTPDLQGKFILGSSSAHAVGTTGGEETHQLTTDETPSHTHKINIDKSKLTISSSGAHTHSLYSDSGSPVSNNHDIVRGVGNGNAYFSLNPFTGTDGTHTHTINGSISGTINNTGGDQAHNNMPPYYTLCYIMKL